MASLRAMRLPPTTSRLVTLIAAAGLAAGLASCGGDDEQPSASLAETAPAGALIYGEATVNPADDQRAALDSLIEKVSGLTGGVDALGELLDEQLAADDAPVTYTGDIEPVLGEQAAFWASDLTVDEFGELESGNGAAVVELSDEGAAQDLLDDLISQAPDAETTQTGTYEDVDYYFEEGQAATGIDDGYLILGTEQGFRDTVDTIAGGDSISDSLDRPARARRRRRRARVRLGGRRRPRRPARRRRLGGARRGPAAVRRPARAAAHAQPRGRRQQRRARRLTRLAR